MATKYGAAIIACALAGLPTALAQEEETDVGFEVFRYTAIVVLVLLSGMFSGLTLGLLGLDRNQLAVRGWHKSRQF